MPSRRQFVKAGVVTGAAAAIAGPRLLAGRAEATTIDPATIPKYVTPLFVLPAMPPARTTSSRDEYSIAARRFTQQMLPSGFPRTAVHGFVSTTDPATAHTPGYTIEATVDRPALVSWWNQLVDASNRFLSSLVTVDPTLHWFNAPGGIAGRDAEPIFSRTRPPYTGPLPFVVHLHGARSYEESDGYPEAWFLPAARNIPAGYATVGSFYDQFKAEARQRWGVVWQPGNAVFVYPNDQPAGTLWYHDHSLGITRGNVYSGLAAMYVLRGGSRELPAGVLPGPAPQPGDAPGKRYYEIPIVLQDKTFNTDGSLFFPASRTEAGDTTGPFVPQTDTPPYWNPIFQGNTTVVNGNTWPFLNVEPRRYRFRFLAASSFRAWTLKIVTNPLAARPATTALPIWVIGSDGGYLPAPAQLAQLPMVTTERYDTIVDFTGLTPGTKLYLINDEAAGDPAGTGQIMQFRVVPLTSRDTTTPPSRLQLPGFAAPPAPTVIRRLSQQPIISAVQRDVPVRFSLGTIGANGVNTPRRWSDPLTENPTFNTTEQWEFNNRITGGHAIHVHLVQFELVNRQAIGSPTIRPPAAHETGPKDVILVPGATADAPNGTITRVKMTFDRRSRYVWHCHVLDHEDHEMMRPFVVS